MERHQITKYWHELKRKIQAKWNKLTKKDMDDVNGDYDQLVNKMEKRYGYSRDDAEKELELWNREEGDRWNRERREEEGSNWKEKSQWNQGHESEKHKEYGPHPEKHKDHNHPQDWNKKKRKAG